MFEQATFDSAGRRVAVPWTMSISVALQATIITTVILFPLLRIEPLPPVHLVEPKLAPPNVALVRVPDFVQAMFRSSKLTMPSATTTIRTITVPTNRPQSDDLIIDQPPGNTLPPGTITAEGPDISIFNNKQPVAQPTKSEPKVERPAVQPPPADKTYRVGGDVKGPSLRSAPPPPYPPLAKATRTQGTVRLNGVISRDGTVRSLELVSGHPLLVQAALNAVRAWLYEPARLNGQPVDVILVIDVNFRLTQ